jgi:hypothetical protein
MPDFNVPHPAENPHRPFLDETLELDWPLRSMRVSGALSGAGVSVHLVDTGLATASHPALHGRLPGAIRAGRDFSSAAGPDANDDLLDHGLAMASVIVGSTEGAPLRGVSPGATVTVHKVHNWPVLHTRGSRRAAAAAIEEAINVGAKLVSISMGWGWAGKALRQAVARADEAGVLVIAAAGQLSTEPQETFPVATLMAPGRLHTVVGVAAGDAQRRACTWSARGPEADVTAPGDGVWGARFFQGEACTVIHKERELPLLRSSGTSLATACTAGVAALWIEHRTGLKLSAAPSLFRQALWAAHLDALTHTSQGAPLHEPSHWGAGWLDLPRLLAADPLQAPPSRPPTSDGVEELLALLLGGEAPADPALARWRLRRHLRELSEDGLSDLLDEAGEELGAYAIDHPAGLRSLLEESPDALLPDAPRSLREALLRSP